MLLERRNSPRISGKTIDLFIFSWASCKCNYDISTGILIDSRLSGKEVKIHIYIDVCYLQYSVNCDFRVNS